MKAPIRFKLMRKKLSHDVEVNELKKNQAEALGFVNAALENFDNKVLTDSQRVLGLECLKSARAHLVNGERQ